MVIFIYTQACLIQTLCKSGYSHLLHTTFTGMLGELHAYHVSTSILCFSTHWNMGSKRGPTG